MISLRRGRRGNRPDEHTVAGAAEDGVPQTASRRCPHGIDHPSWCRTCRDHWQARMRHPSWPKAPSRSGETR